MPTTLRTRKPVDQLTVKDLEAFPVWEYALDEEGTEGMDETWVKPIDTQVVPADSFSLMVASVVKLANGSVYPGVVHCDTAPTFRPQHLALLTTGGRILLDLNPTFGLSELQSLLGLKQDAAVPIEFATRVPLATTGQFAFGIVS
jgi:hypothetical protein